MRLISCPWRGGRDETAFRCGGGQSRRAAVMGLEVDRVPADRLPATCLYSLHQILDPDWLPENVHGIVHPMPEGL